ncbi:MAG: phage major tail tube protein [Magnetococcales bacterium]|nr:phage major tail tube protein [Magnetococcales bacterium]
MIGSTLKDFSLFVDGRGLAGKVTELTPPKLVVKTEEHRAGGMGVPIDIDMGLEKLMCEFTLSEYNTEVLKLFGLASGSPVKATLKGASQSDDGSVASVLIVVRGMFTEIDMGTWKAATKTEKKCKVSCRYYRLEVNGEVIYEVDAVNMIRIVDGVDQMVEIRAAIGL